MQFKIVRVYEQRIHRTEKKEQRINERKTLLHNIAKMGVKIKAVVK